MPGIGMFMWRQLSRWGTIIGLYLACSAEVGYTEKSLKDSARRSISEKHGKRCQMGLQDDPARF
jgi:hypothetical protein